MGGNVIEIPSPSPLTPVPQIPFLDAANATIGSGQLINSLSTAQSQVTIPGSCTVCLCSLFNDGIGGASIEVANLGDSGLRVIRNGSVVFSTRPQEHQFNMPFQLASPAVLKETDTAADADKYSFKVQEGDVVILATDGLYDNLWEEQICNQVTSFKGNGASFKPNAADVQSLARSLASAAHSAASEGSTTRTPWSVESAARATEGAGGWAGVFSRIFPTGGGKMDDVTVIVAVVAANNV